MPLIYRMATILRFRRGGGLSFNATDKRLTCANCQRFVRLSEAVLVDMPKKYMQILCSVDCARAYLDKPADELRDSFKRKSAKAVEQ